MLTSRWISLSMLVTAAVFSVALLASAQLAEEGVVVEQAVAKFDYAGQKYRVFAATSNLLTPNEPWKWNFQYEPLLKPQIRTQDQTKDLQSQLDELNSMIRQKPHQNDLIVRQRILSLRLSVPYNVQIYPLPDKVFQDTTHAPQYRVIVPILLSDSESDTSALNALKVAYRTEAPDLTSNNLDILRISQLTISGAPDIGKDGLQVKEATLRFATFNNPTGHFDVTIDVVRDENLAILVRQLHTFHFDVEISYTVKASKDEVVALTADKVKDTELYTKLSGVPPDQNGKVYIFRHELDHLALNASSEIKGTIVTQDSKSFAFNLVESLVQQYGTTQTVDEATFTNSVYQHTYNPNDISPDELNKEINDSFDHHDNLWESKHGSSSSANGNFFDLVSGGGSGSYNEDNMQHFIDQHGVHAEWDGTKWVPKSIDLVAINLGTFRQSTNVLLDSKMLSPSSEMKDLPGQIALYLDDDKSLVLEKQQ